MSQEFEEKLKSAVTAYREQRERAVAAVERSVQAEEGAIERFNRIVESDVIPLFEKTAELLSENCVIEIHRREYTEERPFASSVEMVVTPKPGARLRRLRQPYPKLEICLKRKTLRMVIFTEHLRAAKLQLEEIGLSELNAEKFEKHIHDFIAEIFR